MSVRALSRLSTLTRHLQVQLNPISPSSTQRWTSISVATNKCSSATKREFSTTSGTGTGTGTGVGSGKAKIYVVYYSTFGHVATLAQEVARGAADAGAEVKLWRVAETLPQSILDAIKAPPPNKDIPVITPQDFKDADGIIMGVPTRYGQGASQTKALWDGTGGLWAIGALVGKVGGVFFSTGTQGGGQETTALTHITHFVHHGMIYVPIGYSHPNSANMDQIHGGSAWGAGTLSGTRNERPVSQLEKELAYHQGKHTATITIALKNGRTQAAKL